MLRSMTGFGTAEVEYEGGKFAVELKSVNHRFIDFSIRLPKRLTSLEQAVKDKLKKVLDRGYITCQVNWEQNSSGPANIQLNHDVLTRYKELMRKMNVEYRIDGVPTVDTFAGLSEVFTRENIEEDVDELWPHLESALDTALEGMVQMRGREGETLANDILDRLDNMKQCMDQANLKGPGRLKSMEQRLRDKVVEAFNSDAVDEQRLIAEITIYADKWDFTEEVVRFDSHLNAIRDTVRSGATVGRKLNFLMQELNREVNTVASKANDAEIAQLMVTCKEEIEKIREQVENIE